MKKTALFIMLAVMSLNLSAQPREQLLQREYERFRDRRLVRYVVSEFHNILLIKKFLL